MKTKTNTMGETRSIDTAKEASTDLVALNNTIVNMRGCVKAAKVQVIHKLTRMIQKLKTKKGTEQQKDKNLKKAQRMLDEVFVIKELNLDKVSKFALQNTTSFTEASRQPTAAVESRSLARLAEHKLLAGKVKTFREEHSDWRDLAAFLYSKQTGRRFKTKKQKLRAAKKGSKFLLGAEATAEKEELKRSEGDNELPEEQDHRLSTDDSLEGKESSKRNMHNNAGDSDERASDNEEVKVRKNHRKNKGEEKEVSDSDENDQNICDEENDNERGDSESEEESDQTSNVNETERIGESAQSEEEQSEQDQEEESSEDDGGEDLEADPDEYDDSDQEERNDINEEEESDEERDSDEEESGEERDSDEEEDAKERESEEESTPFKTSAKKALKRNNKAKESDRAEMLFQKPSEPNMVKDPFFVCDDEDSDAEDTKSGHWIPESSLERANSERLRGGKSRRRGGEREMKTERHSRGDDSRWLTGDFIGDDSGRGFRGRGRGRFPRGRGDSWRGRDGSSRPWENSRRGRGSDTNRYQRRGRGDHRGGSGWRGRGRESDSFSGGRPSRGADRGGRRGRGRGFDRGQGHGGRSSFGDRGSGTRGQAPKEKAGIKKVDNQSDFSHPSWEAKRKRKEMEKTAAFTGKKIKFDD